METNWAHTYTYAAPIVPVTSVADIQAALKEPGPVRALGTRHSFTDVADSPGRLLDVTGLPANLELDTDKQLVRVGAGTRYGELGGWLQERGFALHNLGSLPHINVGGATCTGTHGSGVRNGVLATAIRELTYVGADGDVRHISSDDPDFPALGVGVGSYGILTDLTLAVEPTYQMRADLYRGLTWEAFLSDVHKVMSDAYSVSVFTPWTGDEVGFVWRKARLDTDDPAPDLLLDAHRTQASDPPFGDDGVDANVTEIGTDGTWVSRLPHFRFDAEPSFGNEIQTEYFVGAINARPALEAVRALADEIAPHLFITELRTARFDDFWISPAAGRDSFIIHFTWLNHSREVAALLPKIEKALAPHAPRPHWGKVNSLTASDLEPIYPRLSKARELYDSLDPQRRFVNPNLVRVGVRTG